MAANLPRRELERITLSYALAGLIKPDPELYLLPEHRALAEALAEHGPEGVALAEVEPSVIASITDLYLDYGSVAAEEMQRRLREAARRQRVTEAAMRVVQAAKRGEDYLAAIEELNEAAEGHEERGAVPAKEAARLAIERWRAEREGRRKPPIAVARDPAFPSFDGGGHYILAARTAVGKTALALQFALIAARAGRKVVFYSLEMPAWTLGARLISQVLGIPLHELRDADGLERALALLDVPLFVRDDVDHAEALYADMRRSGADFYVVDYLGLVHPSAREERRELEVARISRALKRLAVKLDVPVLTLAQINRQAEQKRDKRPELSHLRDSGAIEQDADVVMLLWRKPEPGGTLSDEGELVVAKNRHGPTGIWPVHFQGAALRFAWEGA